MPSGDRPRPNRFLALAGIEAGIVGALILLCYLALDSAWHHRSIWIVPNLLASTFFGESAYRPGFGAGTSAGVALLLLLYGLLGLLFALTVRDHGTRIRVLLAGVIYGTAWFFLSFDILWMHVNPLVKLYSPDRAMLLGHVLYGGALGRGFPAYLKSIRNQEASATLEPPVGLPPVEIQGPTTTGN
jgi:hypothetical protein